MQRCLCREVDEIWQYRTGGNLTIFDKDHGTAEEGRRSKVLAAKHTVSLQLPRAAGGNQATLDARTEFGIGNRIAVSMTVVCGGCTLLLLDPEIT
jgi:hypothetical protein